MNVADRHRVAVERIAAASALGPEPRPLRSDEAIETYPPRTAMADMTATTLAAGLASAGCIMVPDLLHEGTAAELAVGIDAAFSAFDRYDGAANTGDPWFDAFVPGPGSVHATRAWLREGGGLFAADSPQMADRWFGLIRSLGVIELVAELFGEEPITSLDKCALRRISHGDGIEWHQDGAFLGPDSGALNLWVSLTDTAESPGLDIVSHRFTEIVETGTGGARYDWATGDEVVQALAERYPIEQPRFRPGDGLLFDGLLLHQTTHPPIAMPKVRYAIETWFFRPSRFPAHQQVPIAF